ncbi:hypothetical protein FHU41_002616 [Psychromicrobium silvestre]|uniref:Sortase family n=1 Tax=Psychromicrobium silvestre TaxID=1645614 RepID=A0A7Y9S8V3_9MICC|nr:class F sortase [Psychromicrobium silvestre]NYE96366.1 hypothetical protein [Psychromicrobium silvestre]
MSQIITASENEARLRKPRVGFKIIIAACVVLMIASAVLLVAGLHGFAGTTEYAPAPALSAPFNASEPDQFEGDTTAPKLPAMTLAIPAVGLEIPLVLAGTNVQGGLDIPESTHAAIYDKAAALKATQGSTLIAGHVNFANAAPAPMADIAKITKGTPIFVSDEKGTVQRFKAIAATEYTKKKLPDAFFSAKGARQLVLLTCGGPIGELEGKLSYLNNTAITALPWP